MCFISFFHYEIKKKSSLQYTSVFLISPFYITGVDPLFLHSTSESIQWYRNIFNKVSVNVLSQCNPNIHKNIFTLSSLSVPLQGPAVTGSSLSKRPLVILFMLSFEELHRLHPSSWAQDYCLVVRDTGSRHGSRTKHGPSWSLFMLSYPRGPACMSVCYISVKSCQFGNSMSQQHHRWDNESSFH